MKDKVRTLSEVFKALGDPTRLRIIKLLASNPENTLCVADLADRLGITQPAVSQHIKVLKNVGVLDSNRVGFRVYYHADKERLTAYKEDVDELFRMVFTSCPEEGECIKDSY